jgi:hypothetical protein
MRDAKQWSVCRNLLRHVAVSTQSVFNFISHIKDPYNSSLLYLLGGPYENVITQHESVTLSIYWFCLFLNDNLIGFIIHFRTCHIVVPFRGQHHNGFYTLFILLGVVFIILADHPYHFNNWSLLISLLKDRNGPKISPNLESGLSPYLIAVVEDLTYCSFTSIYV